MKNTTSSLHAEIMNLEETNQTLMKDKKLLESFINKIVKSFHNRDMSRLLTELIAINFSLIQLNAEKSKYEKQVIQMDREVKKLDEDKVSRNIELKQTIINEKNSLKDLIIKQDTKICNNLIIIIKLRKK